MVTKTNTSERSLMMTQQMVHVRVDGRSPEFPYALLDIAANASDSQLKQAVAEHLELPVAKLSDHVVERSGQAIVVRPEAVYG
jgi:hypothetical protein